MAKFILEIGSEELPARFLKKLEADGRILLESMLAEAGLEHGDMKAMSTPRRLAIIVDNLDERQKEKEELVVGPPVQIAYEKDGKPTKALESFCAKNNIAVEEIEIWNNPKGEYAAFLKKSGGRDAASVLAEILPEFIGRLPFPKSMRWGVGKETYGRPVRWILALLDDREIKFKFGDVASGRSTFGLRSVKERPIAIENAADYEKVLASRGGVVMAADERKKIVLQDGAEEAAKNGGQIIRQDGLLEEVAGLVEKPRVIVGNFDPAYLEMPEEVLLTTMQTHQKCFGLAGNDGKMLPHFLAVVNLDSRDPDAVVHGWEKVIRARLADARFFWNEDRKANLQDWLNKLGKVIFIGPLGSMAAKAERISQFSEWLAAKCGCASPKLAARAGKLAKADLVSNMVNEFDTLQGIMGGIYAKLAGEPEEVAKAIRDHYLPQGPDSPLPDSALGGILAIADKMDTLAGCFGLGKIPTGTADPNGLRRNALGIIRILRDLDFRIAFRELAAQALEYYQDVNWKLAPEAAIAKLDEFFMARLRNYAISLDYPQNVVDAVLAAPFISVPDFFAKLEALASFYKNPENAPGLQAMKRIQNIVKKGEPDKKEQTWTREMLAESGEKDLAEALEKFLPEIDQEIGQGNYLTTLNYLNLLREPVDNFFDNVMVLCEDDALRNNRIALLNAMEKRFAGIADFHLLGI